MKFREALQVRLQERYRRLYKSDWQSFEGNVKYFLQWAEGIPALRGIFQTIEHAAPDVDPDAWWKEVKSRRQFTLPDSEVGRSKIVLVALRDIAFTPGVDFREMTRLLTGETRFDDAIREFCSQWVEPMVEYLQERLSAESDLLYVLERYRRRVAWFEQPLLHQRYLEDRPHGEEIYRRDLQRFLFDEGIDYPFSQPESPSGKVDLVALAETDDALTCEVKLFDGDAYGVPYLAKGVQQALRYAEDYGKTTAYLVVFNLCDRPLELPTDVPEDGWPPRLEVAGITVFLVTVPSLPLPVASRSGKPRPLTVLRSQLVEES